VDASHVADTGAGGADGFGAAGSGPVRGSARGIAAWGGLLPCAAVAQSATALQAALDKVNTLEGLLPVCMGCKRVRDDTGYWSQIDTYLNEHTNASISHGYCPECAAKAFQEYGYDVPSEVEEALAAGRFE